jgi:glycosyltransferase involved in cell wall biosynthesis
MADFADDLADEITRALASGAWNGLRRKSRDEILDNLASYLLLTAAQTPYVISLFHQNKERPFVQRFEHETSVPGDGVSVLERSMRVSLFTDTLGDVNGVCRFIHNMAEEALNSGRDLQVITSTRLKTPAWSNIYNFEPVFSSPMPRYQNLELVFPPLMRILRHVDRHQPDAIHISTPGPVGMIGFIAARMLRVPVLGVYHTDFPAYIDHLFEDQAFTWVTERFMRFFYHPFHTVFTRSEDYKRAVTSLGVSPERVRSLMPGVDTELFHPRFRDPGIWRRFPGARDDSLKALFVGRISIEKNMPFLASVWKAALRRFLADGIDAELIVVGDGPYRKQMEKELGARSAHFLGFRHGHELSSIYASADLFLFPSTTDTLGQVVMEAQASGIPALVSDVGGPREVITEGVTGHVIPIDQNQWIDAICSLLRSPDDLRRMGRAAHHAMQSYSLRSSFEHFWNVHEQAWREHLAEIGIRRDHSHGLDPARDITNAP